MLSPSPPQQSPTKYEQSTETIIRTGQTPAARVTKNIFRPIIKGIYFFLRAITNHKLISLLVLILMVGSAVLTSYLVTRQAPLGVGSDQFQFRVNGKAVGGGDQVKNWLYHLRQGNTAALALDEKYMSQPPDPAQLITQYSEVKANITWKDITVISSYEQTDTSIDTFVNVTFVSHGPGGNSPGVQLWHFVTVSTNGGLLLQAELAASRPLQ